MSLSCLRVFSDLLLIYRHKDKLLEEAWRPQAPGFFSCEIRILRVAQMYPAHAHVFCLHQNPSFRIPPSLTFRVIRPYQLRSAYRPLPVCHPGPSLSVPPCRCVCSLLPDCWPPSTRPGPHRHPWASQSPLPASPPPRPHPRQGSIFLSRG